MSNKKFISCNAYTGVWAKRAKAQLGISDA